MTLLTAILHNDTVKVLVLDNHKTILEYFKEPNTLIAFSAMVLSIVGIIATIITLCITIRHNKLSVEPKIMIQHSLNYDNNFFKLESKNKGLGSAIINSFTIIYKEREFTNFRDVFINDNINIKSDTQFFMFENDYILSSNENEILFKHTSNDKIELNQIINLLEEVRIEIEYESMYGIKKQYIKPSK